MNIIITGAAGFIGMHLSQKFLDNGYKIIGIDNINKYYDPKLKKKRLNILKKNKNFLFFKLDICDHKKLEIIFKKYKPKKIIHLAAQAGVRYSLTNPDAYIKSNIIGFFNIIKLSQQYKVNKFFYASSSSVYGDNKSITFSEKDKVSSPISLYAATKLSNELIAISYNKVYKINCIGLRFFTVYGPWGRPDMALFKFVKNILKNKEIEVYNFGDMSRDFTYIDDVVEGIFKLFKKDLKKGNHIFNIGNSSPVKLMDFVKKIEEKLNKKAKIKYKPLQVGDVKSTYANTKKLKQIINFQPSTKIQKGIEDFVDWYLQYYKIKKK